MKRGVLLHMLVGAPAQQSPRLNDMYWLQHRVRVPMAGSMVARGGQYDGCLVGEVLGSPPVTAGSRGQATAPLVAECRRCWIPESGQAARSVTSCGDWDHQAANWRSMAAWV